MSVSVSMSEGESTRMATLSAKVRVWGIRTSQDVLVGECSFTRIDALLVDRGALRVRTPLSNLGPDTLVPSRWPLQVIRQSVYGQGP